MKSPFGWPRARRAALLSSFLVSFLLPAAASAAEVGRLGAAYYDAWWSEVAPVATAAERTTWFGLTSEAAREGFQQAFWAHRGEPARVRWVRQRRAAAGEPTPAFARAVQLLGPPTHRQEFDCRPAALPPRLEPLAVWRWQLAGRDVLALFRQDNVGAWALVEAPPEPTTLFAGEARSAIHGRRLSLADYVTSPAADGAACGAPADVETLERLLAKPPSWAELAAQAGFVPRDDGAQGPPATLRPLPAQLTRVDAAAGFALRVTLQVRELGLAADTLADLALSGDLLGAEGDDGAAIDTLYYPFRLAPGAARADEIVLRFEHPAPPGRYRLVLRLTGLTGRAEGYRAVIPLTVDPPTPGFVAEPDIAGATDLTELQPNWVAGAATIAISALPAGPLRGVVEVGAQVWGPGVAEVAWELAGVVVARATEPPYRALVDLGALPRQQVLSARARDAAGYELARDTQVVNAGPSRFAVRWLSPAPGQRFDHLVPVQVAVEVPAGRDVRQVELFLGDEPVATLTRPPFRATVQLPRVGALEVLRAVALDSTGATVETTRVLNAPPGAEEVDVRLVEVYLTAQDRRGRLVGDLQPGEVRVSEEGAPQEALRFERVTGLPLSVLLVLDSSDSMAGRIGEVGVAARRFLEEVLTAGDEAGVVTFNHQAQLALAPTAEAAAWAAASEKLTAFGGTALWDALSLATYQTLGRPGRRVLVVLSDGADHHSQLTYAQAAELARRAQVAVYTISFEALDGPQGQPGRGHEKDLEELARATGGRAFVVETPRQLGAIYNEIAAELKSQYLVTYQPPAGGTPGWRRIAVECTRPGVKTTATSGYYGE